MRYQGQEHTVNVPLPSRTLSGADLTSTLERFSTLHRQHYGHSMDDPVEIVTLRLRATGVLPRPHVPRLAKRRGAVTAERRSRAVYTTNGDERVDYAVYDREALRAADSFEGPAIIEERSSTTIIHTGDAIQVGEYGELIIDLPPTSTSPTEEDASG
jgi:N-methylhydantoinase A